LLGLAVAFDIGHQKTLLEIDLPGASQGAEPVRLGVGLDEVGRGDVGADLHQPAVVGVGVHLQGEAQLLEVVGALDAAGRLADFLDGRQQQGDQRRDDGDHHEQFQEGEGSRARTRRQTAGHGKRSFLPGRAQEVGFDPPAALVQQTDCDHARSDA
jgi:hypothetical protein